MSNICTPPPSPLKGQDEFVYRITKPIGQTLWLHRGGGVRLLLGRGGVFLIIQLIEWCKCQQVGCQWGLVARRWGATESK